MITLALAPQLVAEARRQADAFARGTRPVERQRRRRVARRQPSHPRRWQRQRPERIAAAMVPRGRPWSSSYGRNSRPSKSPDVRQSSMSWKKATGPAGWPTMLSRALPVNGCPSLL